jgi:hypothetical protein
MTITTRRALAAAGLSAAALVGTALIASPPATAAAERAEFLDDSMYAVAGPFDAPELMLLVNTSRTELCDGDPSPVGAVPGRVTAVGSGNLVAREDGPVHVEAWRLRAGWTWADAPGETDPLDVVCDDLAGTTPKAAGEVRLVYRDNSADEAGPRTNAFRTTLRGTLPGDDGGGWRLTVSFHDVIHPVDDVVRSAASFSLVRQGR